MSQNLFLPIREANLLRSSLKLFLAFRTDFLRGGNHNTIHDFRVASRRLRELLDYYQSIFPQKSYARLSELARVVTKRLGRAREAEVNIKLLKESFEEGSLEPAVAEFMIHEQSQRLKNARAKAYKRISDKEFLRLHEFLDGIRGSHQYLPVESDILQTRKSEFLSFPWIGEIDDERLHDLRIRTKKFRYALEIYDRLHKRNLGRFINRVKRLQELLGEIHDLYVLAELLISKKKEWQKAGLTVIPAAIDRALQQILARKTMPEPKVYPLYSAITENFPPEIVLTWQISIEPVM